MKMLTINISEERYQTLIETAERERKSLDDIIDDSLDLFGIKGEVPLKALDKLDRRNQVNSKSIQPVLSINKTSKASSIEPKFNGWGTHIIRGFIPPVRYYLKSLCEIILAAFKDFEKESERQFNEDQDWDQACYSYIMDIQQGVINLHAVGLRHLYEQNFSELVMRLLEEREREANYQADEKFLAKINEIKFKEFRSWVKLEELKYVCNAVKHAAGRSAIELGKIRPDLFESPQLLYKWCEIRPNSEFSTKPFPVRNPLAGQDIYPTEKDIKDYSLAIEDFWNEFISVLNNYKYEV